MQVFPPFSRWVQEDHELKASCGLYMETILKNTTKQNFKVKRTEGVAQEVEHLLCKCKALRSNPSPIKKKLKKITSLI
jgi:hypothetical protein